MFFSLICELILLVKKQYAPLAFMPYAKLSGELLDCVHFLLTAELLNADLYKKDITKKNNLNVNCCSLPALIFSQFLICHAMKLVEVGCKVEL